MLKNSGPRSERETVIRFCEGEDNARIWTASGHYFYRLVARGYAPVKISPDQRSAEFIIPKKAVSIRRPRRQNDAS
jgi:hypothetical protein